MSKTSKTTTKLESISTEIPKIWIKKVAANLTKLGKKLLQETTRTTASPTVQ